MWRDMFRELIKEGKSSKQWLLDFLSEIKKRNTIDNVVITDEEFTIIQNMINQMR